MTKQEAVVIETYTHEFPKYADKLKELSKSDFIEICRKLSD